MKFNGFLAGLAVGAVAGSVIALVMAPQSGGKTRELINGKSRELRDKAMDRVDVARDTTNKMVSDGRTQVEKVTNLAKERIENIRNQGQKMVEERREILSEGMHQTADKVDPNS